jgi:ABC-type transport system involved in cytochrome c biogenesis permease subunit
LAAYRQNYLQQVAPETIEDVRYESFFNHFAPFYLCSMLYVMVIILACLSWLVCRKPLVQSAFWLAVVTFLLHTFALGSRMYLQDRPPVTNLYSSAVFIGWGCLLLCLILESFFWKGIALIVGGVLGALTMMIAHFLSEGGDTMEMLQAVLDTNFWLATHVTMVTFGYVATFVAGFIALLYVLFGIFTKAVDQELNKVFGQMLYGVICFATFLSFTGTILGGIWADYSWGRFWGWDAKENGAVMVVIWNTLILHARWAGLVKLRGVAVLAIAGNMITIWSWFGTNQLQAGLHSYGFSTELAERCMIAWVTILALIALGLLPQKYWRSFSEDTLRERAERARHEAQARKELDRETKNRAKALTPGR